jgi:hypothetical protein
MKYLILLLLLCSCSGIGTTSQNIRIPVADAEKVADAAKRTIILADTNGDGWVADGEFAVWGVAFGNELIALFPVPPPTTPPVEPLPVHPPESK